MFRNTLFGGFLIMFGKDSLLNAPRDIQRKANKNHRNVFESLGPVAGSYVEGDETQGWETPCAHDAFAVRLKPITQGSGVLST